MNHTLFSPSLENPRFCQQFLKITLQRRRKGIQHSSISHSPLLASYRAAGTAGVRPDLPENPDCPVPALWGARGGAKGCCHSFVQFARHSASSRGEGPSVRPAGRSKGRVTHKNAVKTISPLLPPFLLRTPFPLEVTLPSFLHTRLAFCSLEEGEERRECRVMSGGCLHCRLSPRPHLSDGESGWSTSRHLGTIAIITWGKLTRGWLTLAKWDPLDTGEAL